MSALLRESKNSAIDALELLCILDAPAQERFARIARVTATAFNAPIAMVSVVDSERQWFKSIHGMERTETSRDTSFCTHAVLGNEVFVVEDALRDPRFADSPLVTGPPYIRFYAGCPLRNADRQTIGTLCVVDSRPRDFTQAQRALLADFGEWAQKEFNEVELFKAVHMARDTSVKLHAIVDGIADSLIITDDTGRIELCNRAAAALFGHAEGTLAGKNLRELIPEPSCIAMQAAPPPDAAHPPTVQETACRCDGTTLHIERKVTCTQTPQGERYIHIMRDTESPGRRDRARSEFLAAAAHELRSPMASIYGFSELLLQRRLDGPKQHELLRVIHDQSAQMSRLINELLDLTRIEAMAGRDFKLARTDAGTLVRHVASCLLVPADRAPVELHVPPGLPAIMVDSDKTQQALTNVLSNAYKYSSEGTVQVSVSHEPGDLLLSIVVRDEGIGMTGAVRERVFERFFRSPDTRGIPGTGLGMSLVKEIMEAQHGLVRIASDPGHWTEVTLLLPLAPTA